MAFNYKKYGPEFYEKYAEELKGRIIPTPLPSEMAEVLFSVPFSQLDKQMTDSKHQSGTILNNLMMALTDYITNQKGTIVNEKQYEVFNNFKLKLENHEKENKLDTEQTHRMLRLTNIEAVNKSYIEQQERFNTRRGDNPGPHSYSLDLSDCMQTLANCNSALRGSSNEYKEIERELKDLQSFLDKHISGEKAAVECYTYHMMKTLAEKADKYVADRAVTEMKHSSNGYKGKRIAAMRNVAATLKLSIQQMEKADERFDEKMTGDSQKKVKEWLADKMGKVTFSKNLTYATVYLDSPGDYSINGFKNSMQTNEIRLECMDKAFHNHVITYDKALKASTALSASFQRIENAIGKADVKYQKKEDNEKALKAMEKQLRKEFSQNRLDGVNLKYLDDNVFEKTPSYLTGDRYDNIITIVGMQQGLKEKMRERNYKTIEPKPLYPGIEGDSPKAIEQKAKIAAENRKSEVDAGLVF